jgi:peptide deformylase
MAVRPIRIWPDPALSEKAKPVGEVTDEIRTLVTDLFDTMYDSQGIGLAATQVAAAFRVVVIDLDPKNTSQRDAEVREELQSWGYAGPMALINPEIIKSQGEIIWDEGCLSVPGVTDSVKRKEHITVRALDRRGQTFEFECSGLFAVCVQHEMDHLDGKVFVEYLSKLKRDVIKRKMLRLKAGDEDVALPAAAGAR